MMCHALPRGTEFWFFLLSIDQDLAERARQGGCPCGGRLHCANYPRSPRGGPDSLPEGYRYRLSFCCDRNGCRKRVTPQSVRFLGRRVYLAAVVILIAAMRQGPTSRRVRELSNLIGADRATLLRWQGFWREHFPQTPFWKGARGRLVPMVEVAVLPQALVEAFVHADGSCEEWARLLRFLAPITVPGGRRTNI